MSRGYSPFSVEKSTEQIPEGKEPVWFKDFEQNLKTAVNPFNSIHEQINSIMNGNVKSKFSSVEELVDDMQERTGLKQFLNSKLAEKVVSASRKNASEEPEEFRDIPELKTFIDNYVEARPGTSIDAVVADLAKEKDISSKLEDTSDASDAVKRYINQKIFQVKKDKEDVASNMHLGKVDVNEGRDEPGGGDPLAFCEPSKVGSNKLRFFQKRG